MIELNCITKSFHSKDREVLVLDDISFRVGINDFLCIIGPNGCGKTTLFNIIAGLDKNFSGSVIKYQSISKTEYPGLVFQQYEQSLMPWLNCRENILFPFADKEDISKEDRGKILTSLINTLGIHSLPLDSYPYQMSGGEKQMACIARAMIMKPALLLLDEPFSSLDYYRKQELYNVLQRVYQFHKTSIVLITHNIDEGILLADQVLLLSGKPTHILKGIKVNLKRPRKESDFSSKEFIDIRNEIIDCFEKQPV